MIQRCFLVLSFLFTSASHSESLFDQIKGQAKVTIGTTVTANNMARVITKGPLLGNDFSSEALSAVNEIRGDPEKALVFIAVDVINMSVTATDWEWRLLYQVSLDKAEREFICERKFSINWANAMWSWQRAGLAFKKIAVECGSDFLRFLKQNPAEKPPELSKIIINSLNINIEDQISTITNAQHPSHLKTNRENQSETSLSTATNEIKEDKKPPQTRLDVIGLMPMVSTRDDVINRSSKRIPPDTNLFQIGGFDLPCIAEYESEKLNLLACITGGEKNQDNIEIHNVLKAGFTKKFGTPTLISNDPLRNTLEGNNTNEQLVWLDSIGNALILFARQGKLTQGSMVLISAEAIQTKRQSMDLIEKSRKF